MKITHILRGEEHISNTPYQIVIKKALGFDSQEIKYGHLSIIVDESGKKLSKRNLQLKQFIEDYKKLGYLPEAIINFLALLGWTSSNNKEIMSISELIANFDPLRISKAPAFFDVKKMQWISNQYFKKMSDDEYIKFVTPFVNVNFEEYQIDSRTLLLMFKNQLEFASQINYLITDAFDLKVPNFNDPMIKEIIEMPCFFEIVKLLKSSISSIDKISFNDASSIIETIKESLGLKGKELFMPIRLITSLKIHGPELNKTITVIGKKKILDNIDKYFNKAE